MDKGSKIKKNKIHEEFLRKKFCNPLPVLVDENPDLAAHLGIMSISTFILFKKGKEVERIVGAFPKQVLPQRIHSGSKKNK